MELYVDNEQKPTGVPFDHEIGPGGARLRLELDEDEVLVIAELQFDRAESADPSLSLEPTIGYSHPDPDNIVWLTADWGSARYLREFTLNAPPNTELRLGVARGKSSWYAAPGPHTFLTGPGDSDTASLPVTAILPDTVADRLMIEFFASDGTPKPVPRVSPTLVFDPHARELDLRLTGGRRIASGTPPFVVGDLLDSLERQVPDALEGGPIQLELSAGICGKATLVCYFTAAKLIRKYVDAPHTVQLDFDDVHEIELNASASVKPRSLSFAVSSALIPRRAIFGPKGSVVSRALAQLCQPGHDNAQPFSLSPTQPLTAVGLYAGPLGDVPVDFTLELRADERGVPGELLAKAAHSLAADEDPGWRSFELAEPTLMPASWWLCVVVQAGELLWYLGDDRDDALGEPCYRSEQGTWIGRDARTPGRWALTRLFIDDLTGAPPTYRVVLRVGDETRVEDLTVTDGYARWVDDGSVDYVAHISLRLVSTTAARVTLSNLRLQLGKP